MPSALISLACAFSYHKLTPECIPTGHVGARVRLDSMHASRRFLSCQAVNSHEDNLPRSTSINRHLASQIKRIPWSSFLKWWRRRSSCSLPFHSEAAEFLILQCYSANSLPSLSYASMLKNLVDRFQTTMMENFNFYDATLKASMTEGGWQLVDLPNDYFIVKFNLEDDMNEVLCGGPWIIAGQISKVESDSAVLINLLQNYE
ncbi:hypothetical protein ACLB2K_055814 [Fragaria x ananassa]